MRIPPPAILTRRMIITPWSRDNVSAGKLDRLRRHHYKLAVLFKMDAIWWFYEKEGVNVMESAKLWRPILIGGSCRIADFVS